MLVHWWGTRARQSTWGSPRGSRPWWGGTMPPSIPCRQPWAAGRPSPSKQFLSERSRREGPSPASFHCVHCLPPAPRRGHGLLHHHLPSARPLLLVWVEAGTSCASLTGPCSLAQGCMGHESTAQGNTWPQGMGHITPQWAAASSKIFLHGHL